MMTKLNHLSAEIAALAELATTRSEELRACEESCRTLEGRIAAHFRAEHSLLSAALSRAENDLRLATEAAVRMEALAGLYTIEASR